MRGGGVGETGGGGGVGWERSDERLLIIGVLFHSFLRIFYFKPAPIE